MLLYNWSLIYVEATLDLLITSSSSCYAVQIGKGWDIALDALSRTLINLRKVALFFLVYYITYAHTLANF